MNKLLLASNNKGKLAEIRELLMDKYEVLSLSDMNIDVDVEETGTTFYDNALIKATEIYKIAHIPVVSDDSGLIVSSLNGEPGVYSARYAGEEHDDEANNAKLLKNLADKKDRTAAFVCCAVYFDGNKTLSAEGKVDGRILFAPEGNDGFGYDPLFYSDELKKSFGVATREEKNTVSHRARAFTSLAKKL